MSWDEIIGQGHQSLEDVDAFDSRERKYKLKIAEALREVLEEARSNGDWRPRLRSALGRTYEGQRYNLSNYRQHDWLRDIPLDAVESTRLVLAGLAEEVDSLERYKSYEGLAMQFAGKPGSNAGSILAVASILNFAVEPNRLPILRSTVIESAEKLVGFEVVGETGAEIYASHLNFINEAEQRLLASGVPVRDTLDTQSVIWEWWYEEEEDSYENGTPGPPRSRKVAWMRDELILALDLYIREGRNPSPESINELSKVLRSIPVEIHLAEDPSFRNQKSVHAKVSNFVSIDPQASTAGMKKGGKGTAEVWDEFASDPERLRQAAISVRSMVGDDEIIKDVEQDFFMAEAAEGRLVTRKHQSRERNRKLIESKKKSVLESEGLLACEACGFDFTAVYGVRGEGFVECHHTIPVSEMEQGAKTHVKDLALLCANCHRMIHRRAPWLEVEELRELLADQVP